MFDNACMASKWDISFDWGDPLWPLEHIVRRVSPLVPWCSRTTRMAWILVRYLPVLGKATFHWGEKARYLACACDLAATEASSQQSTIFQFRSTAGWDQNIYLFRLTWKTKPGFKHETNQRHRDAWPCGGSLGCKTVQVIGFCAGLTDVINFSCTQSADLVGW